MENKILQLKIVLKNIRPPIWRRILIPSDSTFWELHIAIQDSFGWEDYHLHEFFIGKAYDRNAIRINLPYPEDNIFGDKTTPLIEYKTILSDFLNKIGSKINYIYDFGDNWEHEILLEKISKRDLCQTYPYVLSGKRACPWEDSGGPYAYQDKINILKNKNHKEYNEIADWVGINNFEELDLESFYPNDVIFRNPATELQRTLKGFEEEFGPTFRN